jgi:hypothetical protein
MLVVRQLVNKTSPVVSNEWFILLRKTRKFGHVQNHMNPAHTLLPLHTAASTTTTTTTTTIIIIIIIITSIIIIS